MRGSFRTWAPRRSKSLHRLEPRPPSRFGPRGRWQFDLEQEAACELALGSSPFLTGEMAGRIPLPFAVNSGMVADRRF